VCDFIDQVTRQWDTGRLDECIGPVDVEIIKSISISTRAQPDFWSWHYEKKGIFSVRSAYRMLVATRERREAWLDESTATSGQLGLQQSWEKLWHILVPSKLRIFSVAVGKALSTNGGHPSSPAHYTI
jgi:hypothetical protein